jgi:hypothetical protein
MTVLDRLDGLINGITLLSEVANLWWIRSGHWLDLRVGEHGSSEEERLVETDCDYEEG